MSRVCVSSSVICLKPLIQRLEPDETSERIAEEFMEAIRSGSSSGKGLYDAIFSVFGWEYLVMPILCKLPHDGLVFVGDP